MVIEMTADITRRRFTVDEYQRMAEAGIFGPDERVELIDGEIVPMTPIGPTHASVVDRLNRFFVVGLADRAIVRIQHPVVLSDRLMPQPDVAVALPREDWYRPRHPVSEELPLLIEVADSSLLRDQNVKLPAYGRAGVAESWLVDLVHRRVVVHREPAPSGYERVVEARPGDQVAPEAFPDLVVGVRDLVL